MKKNNKYLVLVILSILVSISGLSVSVLAYSASYNTLKYMELAKKNAKSKRWNVHFENLSSVNLGGTAKEIKEAVINDDSTYIGSFRIQFNSIKDTASYTFDVVNAGMIDAVLRKKSISEPLCSGTMNTAINDAAIVCDNFKYKLTYLDGSEMEYGDVLLANSKRTLKITMWYDGDTWPINSVMVYNLSASVIYSQK